MGSWKGRGNQYIQFIRFCTVNCQPTASNYQLSHLRPCRELNPGLRGGRRERNHSATVAPLKSEDLYGRDLLYFLVLATFFSSTVLVNPTISLFDALPHCRRYFVPKFYDLSFYRYKHSHLPALRPGCCSQHGLKW